VPKVFSIYFSAESPGSKVFHKVDVNVDSSGTFSANIPEELEDTVRSLKKADSKWDNIGIDRYRGRARIVSKRLDQLSKFSEAVATDYVACEVKKEVVILYGTNIDVAYWKEKDGTLLPSGVYAKKTNSLRGENSGEWHGKLNGLMKQSTHYSVGFVARAVLKVTFIRKSGSVTAWSYTSGLENHHGSDTSWHAKLNSFTGTELLHGDATYHGEGDDRIRLYERTKENLKEMPFSDEAAKFFYEVMIGLCAMADRIDGFFADDKKVQAAIQSGAQVLLAKL
jgi:hypothetical protein